MDEARRGASRSLQARLARASPQAARWGLLLTTVVTAAALLGTGFSSYLHARSTAAAVTRSLAFGMFFSARQAIAAAGGTDSEELQSVLAAMEPQGVRYIAVVDEEAGAPRAAAGTARPASELLPPERLPEGSALAVSRDGSWVRFVGPLGGRGPRGMMGRGRGMMSPRDRLVLDFESVTANQTVSQAIVTLALSCAAAVVLLTAALFFWRLSRRAERAAAQSERDRRLKALGEMSAVLGHELRNPLAALKGHAQLLLERLPEEHPGHRGAQTIVREAVRLEDLASNVLEFVRSGKVEPESTDPVAVARAAVEASGDSVKLAVNGPIPAWPLDRARIEAVLVNLLRNARQSSPGDGDVELAVAAAGGRDLVFEVRDNGVGIDPEDQERMFEPFFTRRAKGTGLGLALARQIVEGHGGRISAENRPGGGAVFRVTIPRTPPASAFSGGG